MRHLFHPDDSTMLARLLRISYALQVGLGALLAYLLLPIDDTPARIVLGAVFLPLFLQALLTLTSVSLSASGWSGEPLTKTQLLWRIGRLWIAEWKAAFTVFALRQPWSRRAPSIAGPLVSSGGRASAIPVLLVHGYICNHRVWDEVVSALRRRGHAVLAIDLEPVFTSIDNYASQIETAVQTLRSSTGSDKVALIGHSMGGLVIRAWMRACGTQHVHRAITLGSPHQGTQLAALANTPNGQQMRWQSPWLAALAEHETPETRERLHIVFTDADNIVYPQRSQILQGAAVTTFPGLGHLELCLDPAVVTWLCEQLDDPADEAKQHAQHASPAAPQTTMASESLLRPRRPADLFWAFSWIALQGFGGVLAVLQRELVDRKKWLTQTQFVEDWSVSQILPGPNVVNLALMMGDRYFGWRGSVAALSGIVIFPMLLVLALAVFFSGVSDLPAVQGALRGMGAVAAGMIAGQGFRLLTSLSGNVLGAYRAYAVALATFIASALLGLPLVWILAIVGVTACVTAYVLLGQQPHDRRP